jgi:D-alanine-D-alanine ligase
MTDPPRRARKPLHVAMVYNADRGAGPDAPEDHAGMAELRRMIRNMATTLTSLGHKVAILPLARDFSAFPRKLRRLRPDVVFNQYDDVMCGALYEMRIVAAVRMLGYPITGSPALAVGLSRNKYLCASLLRGVGVPIPPSTELLDKVGDVDRHEWTFPVLVKPAREDAGIGVDRDSVVHSKQALRHKVRHILKTCRQPALAQHFLPGREFNVGIVGGTRLRLMPLAEVNYTELPPAIPPIMSYAAKWLESSEEYQKTSVICPATVGPELTAQLNDVALRAFRAVGAWGYGRVDIRLDTAGLPRVLEVNCNACLEEGLGLSRSAEKAGISYPELLQMILEAALEGPPFDVAIPMK